MSRKLWAARVVTPEDVAETKVVALKKRLDRLEFNWPLLEKYDNGSTFYGIYDPTRNTPERASRAFCARAVSFFEDVAKGLPKVGANDQADIYPRFENRRRIVSHLKRERSGLLATECKIRDKYRCQVCGFRFKKMYGELGADFAEAHHRVPLSRLGHEVRTQLQDLTTVCANCHRMLHKMEGRPSDLQKLRAIVRRHRKTK